MLGNLYSLLYSYYTILTIDDQCKAPTTTIQVLRPFHLFEAISYRTCVSLQIVLSFQL